MDERLRAICLTCGVFLRSEAMALGYDDRTIAQAVRTRQWHRVRRGAYTFADVWASADDRMRHGIRARAVTRAAKTDVVLSHTTAALEHVPTYWGIDLSDVHVTRLDGRAGRAEAGVRQHRGLVLPEDVWLTTSPPTTTPVRAALELTTVAGTEQALVTVNAMLHAGLFTAEDLRERYDAMTYWPYTLATDLVIRLADARMESAGETRTAYALWREGVPTPDPQYELFDDYGRLMARLDFAWPELGVWVEFDGREKYTRYLKEGETVTDAVLREKRREERIRERTGWICVRVTWAELADPRRLAARVRAAFASQQASRVAF
ncbi:MAG: type IV toxin-antitoxin system AbiEi family antitoxin domain-containing protein [Nocardioides sp.]